MFETEKKLSTSISINFLWKVFTNWNILYLIIKWDYVRSTFMAMAKVKDSKARKKYELYRFEIVI